MPDRTPSRARRIARRVAGYLWLAVWIAVLWAVAAPWRHLGGLESEFLRWLETVVLGAGVLSGFTIGRFAREAAEGHPARTHASLLRFLLYPLAALTAGALVALAWSGERGPVGVVATAFLAYWAGLDLAFGAVPLMEGKPYAFDAPLPREEAAGANARRRRPDDAWVPPWERI
jgi:hypothetical protein